MFKFLMEEVTDGQVSGGAAGSGGGAEALNIADGGGNAGSGAAAQSVGDSGGQSGGSGGDAKSWLESLPDDVKSDPSLKVFKDVGGLAKSYVNAQKMIGADRVVLPNEKSSDEEWNAFYQKLGRPESAEKYEIKGPDGKPIESDVTKAFKDTAFKLGLSPKQVAGLAEWNSGQLTEAQKAQETAKTNEVRDSIKAYADKLGGDEKYKARVDQARVAVRALANPELSEFLKTSGLGSRPEMIEFFAQLHGMMGEDKIRDGTGVSFQGEDPATLQKEIEAIETKMFADVNNPRVMEWSEQAIQLRNRLNAARTRSA